MRYYFAGRYSRHAELAAYRDRLCLAIPNTVVTSRWIDCHNGELEASYTPEVLNADPAGCWKHGRDDLDDLMGADAIVSFTGGNPGGKGGRHVEHGWALALHNGEALDRSSQRWPLRLIVVGPRENIFHTHPATAVFPDFDAFLRHEFEVFGAAQVARQHPGLVEGT